MKVEDELLRQLCDESRCDDQAFPALILPESACRSLGLEAGTRRRLTSASRPARYASKVLARCCRLVKGAEDDSAIMTSAIMSKIEL